MDGQIKVGDFIECEDDGLIDEVVEIIDRETFPYRVKSGLWFPRGGSKKVNKSNNFEDLFGND